DAAEDRVRLDHDLLVVEERLAEIDLDAAEDRVRVDAAAGPPATLAGGGAEHRDHVVIRVHRDRADGGAAGRGGRAPLVGYREVPDEHVQLPHRLGGQHALDTRRVLVGGQTALGEGLAQDVGDTVPVGVGGAQLG